MRLAEETNAAAGGPVDATQLAAAIYMHDVGMMFAPESAWLKPDRLTEDDWVLIRAIAEVNACDDQFAAEWIEPFNRVIRKIVED